MNLNQSTRWKRVHIGKDQHCIYATVLRFVQIYKNIKGISYIYIYHNNSGIRRGYSNIVVFLSTTNALHIIIIIFTNIVYIYLYVSYKFRAIGWNDLRRLPNTIIFMLMSFLYNFIATIWCDMDIYALTDKNPNPKTRIP